VEDGLVCAETAQFYCASPITNCIESMEDMLDV